MRLQHKALLAALAFANVGLLGFAAVAAGGLRLVPIPSLVLAAPVPTSLPSSGPQRTLPTPPVVHFQNPGANAPVPTATMAPPVIEAQPTSAPAQVTAQVPALPVEAFVEGVVGHRQSLPLSCESRSAVDWAAFFGINVAELEFLNQLPVSDDPDRGFVGDVRGQWGQVPPGAYGVHAGPVARVLNGYGLPASAQRYMKWPAVQAEIAAGRPVIVWVVGHVDDGVSQVYTASDGRQTIVAPFEHTVILVGYTADTVTVVDGANVRKHSLQQFLRSWEVLRNMAVVWEA